MNLEQALSIFRLPPQNLTVAVLKKTYRRLCSQYHPDRNPTGTAQMQAINAAWDYLRDFSDEMLQRLSRPERSTRQPEYSTAQPFGSEREAIRKLQEAPDLNMAHIYALGIIVVTGNTFPYKDILKAAKFRWHPEKRWWWRHA